LRTIPCGGSAVPKALSEAYREQTGLPILQAWGMTETSPIAAVCTMSKADLLLPLEEQAELRTTVGLIAFGVEMRVVEPGTTTPQPWDGETSGELQKRRDFRLREELREIVARRLELRAREICTGDKWETLQDGVLDRSIDPWSAADEMLKGVGA
jgi:fatty-acyl-CoA synthase